MTMVRAIPLLSGAASAVLSGAAAAALAVTAMTPATAAVAGRAGVRSGTAGSITSILRSGEIVTGVRGTGHGAVVLTGTLVQNGSTAAILYRGRLASAAGAAASVLHPAFRGVTAATFYGPDTHEFNPRAIPAGKVRAVGSYVSSAAPRGVHDQGMIYLGPVSGRHGTWRSINVPADGRNVTGHVRACPRWQRHCHVMDTIPHSTMGNLVVGNYDLNPSVRGGIASGNAFIYNITRRRWTLLRLHHSLSTKTTLYAIWQDGGPGSPRYTLAGGSSAHGGQRGFLIDYNERTGAFGRPVFYSYGNRPAKYTHFEGITAAPGGFNLVAMSAGHDPALVYVPVRGGSFGRARWYPVPVAASPLCPCQAVSGNTVWRNHVMGLFVPASSPGVNTYLATLQAP